MKLEEISSDTLKKISKYLYDRIIEKHEGPERWDYLLKNHLVEFINVNGFDVLLPVDEEHHPNISILRCIVSDDKQSLTIFLKDTTYETGTFAGYVAVCDKAPGEEWYIAILYHEIIDHQHTATVRSPLTRLRGYEFFRLALELQMTRAIFKVIAITLMLALFSTQPSAQQAAEKNNSAPNEADIKKFSAMELYCFNEVNRRRKEHGLAELQFSEQLRTVARAYSRQMVEEGFFSHTDPQGRASRERVGEAGLKWTVLAENLLRVKGFINPVPPSVDRWMENRAHRQNILEPDHEFSGVGVWMAADETYFFTQLFLSNKPQEKKSK